MPPIRKKRGFDWTDELENGEENNRTQLCSKENLWDWKPLAKPNQLWGTLSGVGKVVQSRFFPSKLTQQVAFLETSGGQIRGWRSRLCAEKRNMHKESGTWR